MTLNIRETALAQAAQVNADYTARIEREREAGRIKRVNNARKAFQAILCVPTETAAHFIPDSYDGEVIAADDMSLLPGADDFMYVFAAESGEQPTWKAFRSLYELGNLLERCTTPPRAEWTVVSDEDGDDTKWVRNSKLTAFLEGNPGYSVSPTNDRW